MKTEDDVEAWEGYDLNTEDVSNGDEFGVDAWHNRTEKLSAEAKFGIKRIGSVSIPESLKKAITALISRA